MAKKNSCTDLLAKKNPWQDSDNKIWLASSITLFRNLEKFNFPGKLNSEKRNTIIDLISKELLKIKDLNSPVITRAEEMTPIDKEFLMEHFLSTEVFQQAHAGEAFCLDSSATFMASINMLDHLHFTLIEYHGELENAWNNLIKVETKLGKTIQYAFSPRYGFLTADATNCGTAMKVAVFLQLPALIHSEKIDEILQQHTNENFEITGLHGSPTEIVGDIIKIQNNYTLGLTEENNISAVRNLTTKLMLEENSVRSHTKQNESADMKDRVSRAYGILMHSYQIEAIEALNALSLIKLGVDFNWIEGVSIKELNELFFNCRRAHLLCQAKEEFPQEKLPHQRAEFIHNALKKVKLKI
ncbi:MAG: protein arginine kinase [Chlamydiales bacterium]|nr:protein arginine kinase [Chlamydiia bacterium]MCP5507514.1 protein arginine kinase [Chlamydiales bacterium]